jgi:hypothetical protein
MVKRRVPTSTNGGRGYAVGYRKPPLHSRFQPGQSGNPAGRRKGIRNLMTDVKRTLTTPVRVKEAGRMRRRSTQEGALMVLREKALQGDSRALDRLLELALRFNNDATEAGPAQALSTQDQAILAAYVVESTGVATTRPPAALTDHGPPTRRRLLKKKGGK